MGAAASLGRLAKSSPLMIAGGVVAIVALYIVKRTADAVPDVVDAVTEAADAATGVAVGVATGNNTVTQTATNASGERVTAYEGTGILGTLGAATNAVSGGMLASGGEILSTWLFDRFGPKVDLTNRAAPPAGTITTRPMGEQTTTYQTGAAGWRY